MQKTKKIPLRKCLGCCEMKPKKELIRIVRSPENDVKIDKIGKSPGRGCYVCPSITCLNKAIKAKRIQNSLQTQVNQNLLDLLREQIEIE